MRARAFTLPQKIGGLALQNAREIYASCSVRRRKRCSLRLRSLRFGSAACAARSHHLGPIVGIIDYGELQDLAADGVSYDYR